MKKILLMALLILTACYTQSQNITGYEYWFDNDFATKSTSAVTPANRIDLNLVIPAAALQEGVHTLNIRAWDSNKKYSGILSQFFYKTPASATANRNITAYEYWVDNSYSKAVKVNATPQKQLSISSLIQVDTLKDGIHTFNIRFKDSGKTWSSTLSQFFYKTPASTTANRNITAYEYWVDNSYSKAVKVNATPQKQLSINSLIQVDTLRDGIHTFNIRFKDSGKAWSSTLSQFFYKAPASTTANRDITAYEYWMDNSYSKAVKVNATPQKQLSISSLIQADTLKDGIHTFNIRFKDSGKAWSSTLSQFFYKAPASVTANREITAYEYWMDNSYDKAVKVNATPQKQLSISSLILADTLKDGIHTFNIRFKDSGKTWSSTLSQFFYKAPKTGTISHDIVGYEYWLDNDYANVVKVNSPVQHQLSIGKMVSVQNLTNGIHTFNIRVKDNAGLWSSTASQFFYKMQAFQQVTNHIVGYRYWFDDDYSTVVNVQLSSVVEQLNLAENLDISQVAGGKHSINFQFRDVSGLWSVVTTDSITTTDVVKINLAVNQVGATLTSQQNDAEYQWLDCGKNYALIPGETLQSFTATANGSYAVAISYKGITDTTDCYEVTNAGIKPVGFNVLVRLWPNPTSGPTRIDLGDTYRNIHVTITDISGKTVNTTKHSDIKTFSIELSGEPAGIYFISVTADGHIARLKLLKK